MHKLHSVLLLGFCAITAFAQESTEFPPLPADRYLHSDTRKGAELLMDLQKSRRQSKKELRRDELVIQDLRSLAEDNPDNAVFALDKATVDRMQAEDEAPVFNLPGPPDPLEKVNRMIWYFNDKFYQVFVTPVKNVYVFVVPVSVRNGISRFSYNAASPVRITNSLLQGRPKQAGQEFLRFIINTTIGIAGIFDPATKLFHMKKHDADFGQTLGKWGMKAIFYIVIPFLGPSNVRDGVGKVGDTAMNPLTYQKWFVTIMVRVNDMVYSLQQYQAIKRKSYDSYGLAKKLHYWMREAKVLF